MCSLVFKKYHVPLILKAVENSDSNPTTEAVCYCYCLMKIMLTARHRAKVTNLFETQSLLSCLTTEVICSPHLVFWVQCDLFSPRHLIEAPVLKI